MLGIPNPTKFVIEPKNFQNINANRPFSQEDSYTAVANKIGALYHESINDTLSLLDYSVLEKAVSCMLNSHNIFIIAVSVSLDMTWNFKRNMQRLGKTVILEQNSAEQFCSALSATPQDCAIVVTYSGSPHRVLEEVTMLHNNKVPIILLTGIGDNSVRPFADYILDISTRERLFSKIGNFSTEVSVHLLLDILYSCYFSAHYNENWKKRLDTAHYIESARSSKNEIMKE